MPLRVRDILSPIRNRRMIASGRGIRMLRRLVRKYGGRNWRKMAGEALIRDERGHEYEAEIHWYEAHGIGRRDIKVKRPLP
jgi:hypothetical protein